MRYTKDILPQINNEAPRTKTPSLKKTISDWLNLMSQRTMPLKSRKISLNSGIERQLIYTPMDIKDFSYKDIGMPGSYPFVRGNYATMYQDKEFTMRQLTGLGSPKETNERIKFMLQNGGTGISVLFDIPTIQMYDSDHYMSHFQVGRAGVCVDSLEDMRQIFEGIDIVKNSVSLVTHYPTNTALLFGMYLAMSHERGISWSQLRGSVQNDTTMEEVVRSAPDYISPKDCFKIQCDNVEFIRKHVPQWNVATFNGYNLREAGTSGTMEMAVAICNAIATLEEMKSRGHDVAWTAKRFSFFWSISSDFFEEACRLRAVRRLWSKIMKYRFGVEDPAAMIMKCHVQTSGISLTRQEPMNNIVRSAYQALSAILGGVQSLHVDSYDEAYCIPSEEAALISLRTQQIVQQETGVTDVIDPLGGSFYVEALTNQMESRIMEEIHQIEQRGGYLELISSGALQQYVEEFSLDQQNAVEIGDISVVGVNKHKGSLSAEIPGPVFNMKVEEEQIEKLRCLRANRDSKLAQQHIKKLIEGAKAERSILPLAYNCATNGCTLGEMSQAIKDTFGLWTARKGYTS